MTRWSRAAGVSFAMGALLLSVRPVAAQPASEPPPAPAVPAVPHAAAGAGAEKSGRELFEQVCASCHGLDLPSRQRLNRANWQWVIDDMVNLYGCNWTTDAERAKILDYLVENFGPDKPR